VDRFLEHRRIFYFENAGRPDVFLGSADWMPRNFFRRIESLFPIEDAALKHRVRTELLGIPLADEAKAWLLRPSGAYRRARPKRRCPLRSQIEFIKLAGGAPPQPGLPKPRPAGRHCPEAELPAP
jgi:polyphosphate kinase